jgi:hypothetical protein
MTTRLLSFVLLLSFVSLGETRVLAQTESTAKPAGRIVAARVRGTVIATVKATQVETTIVDTGEISQGSTVSTGKDSSVILVFSNGATINLGADALLDIEEFTQDPFTTPFNAADATEEPTSSTTRLNMRRGELVGHVAKLHRAKGSKFDVSTPVGAAGIRGTTFRIVYRPNGAGHALFTMTTLEGTVEVTIATGSVATSAPVSVGASTEVTFTAEVTTDGAGNVTVTLPSGASTTVATTASNTTLQQVTEAAQQIAQAVANVVITPAAPAPASGTPATGTSTETKTETKEPTKETTATSESKAEAPKEIQTKKTPALQPEVTTPVLKQSNPSILVVSPSSPT